MMSVPVRQAGRGFTYLIALFAVAVLGAGLASIGSVWHTASVRQKEAELLFVGNAYRNAIASYVARGPGIYPTSLEQLLKDPRFPNTVRHLRAPYRDPLTNSTDWGLVVAPGGGILGVFGKSEARPRGPARTLGVMHMQSRTFGSRVLSIGAAAAFSLASSAAAQTPSLPADKGAPAPARGELPADIFQPPPVPGFMLRRQEKPLTQEEMLREAEEAAARVRQPSQPQRATTPDAASPAQLQNSVK